MAEPPLTRASGRSSFTCIRSLACHQMKLPLLFLVHVESAGARLVYLAAYSPIDNPIEMGFNVFKACWKREKWLEARALEYRVRYCLENCYAHPEEAAAATYRECGLVQFHCVFGCRQSSRENLTIQNPMRFLSLSVKGIRYFQAKSPCYMCFVVFHKWKYTAEKQERQSTQSGNRPFGVFFST